MTDVNARFLLETGKKMCQLYCCTSVWNHNLNSTVLKVIACSQTDRQPDRQTDSQTDRQSEIVVLTTIQQFFSYIMARTS